MERRKAGRQQPPGVTTGHQGGVASSRHGSATTQTTTSESRARCTAAGQRAVLTNSDRGSVRQEPFMQRAAVMVEESTNGKNARAVLKVTDSLRHHHGRTRLTATRDWMSHVVLARAINGVVPNAGAGKRHGTTQRLREKLKFGKTTLHHAHKLPTSLRPQHTSKMDNIKQVQMQAIDTTVLHHAQTGHVHNDKNTMARQTTRIITPAGGEGGVGPGVLYSFKQRRPEVRKTHAPPVAKLCKRAGRRHAQLRTALVTKVTTGLLPPSCPTAGGPHRRGRQCNAASLIRPQPGGATPPPGGRRTDGGRGWAGGLAPSRPTVRWSGCRRAWQEPHTGDTRAKGRTNREPANEVGQEAGHEKLTPPGRPQAPPPSPTGTANSRTPEGAREQPCNPMPWQAPKETKDARKELPVDQTELMPAAR